MSNQNQQYFSSYLDEARAMTEGAMQVRAMTLLSDLPLIVLTRGLGAGADEQLWQVYQAEQLKRSPHSQQLFADTSGHNVEIDQPQAAVGAIVKMVEQLHQAATK